MPGENLLVRQSQGPEVLAPLLVDEQEARRLLGGLSPKTMYNLRQRGLPFVKVGSFASCTPPPTWLAGLRVRGKPALTRTILVPAVATTEPLVNQLVDHIGELLDSPIVAVGKVQRKDLSNGDNRQ